MSSGTEPWDVVSCRSQLLWWWCPEHAPTTSLQLNWPIAGWAPLSISSGKAIVVVFLSGQNTVDISYILID
jgi:hypothetical protein